MDVKFTNGAFLDPSAAALAGDVFYGLPKFTGSITMYQTQGALAAAWPHGAEELMDDLTDNTYNSFKLSVGVAGDDMDITCPFMLTGPPALSKLNDILTVTFNFESVFVSTTIFPKVHIPNSPSNIFCTLA
jgi:hypothetical protein